MSNVNIIRILTFDPSLSCTGWAVIDYKIANDVLVVARFDTIRPAQQAIKPNHRDCLNKFGKKVVTLEILRNLTHELIDEYKPDFIVTKEPNHNPDRPSEYQSQLFWITCIKLLCYREFSKPLYRVNTRLVNNTLVGSSTTNKILTRTAIFDNDRISFRQKKKAEGIGEQESESVAVGYCFVSNILPGILSAESPLGLD